MTRRTLFASILGAFVAPFVAKAAAAQKPRYTVLADEQTLDERLRHNPKLLREVAGCAEEDE